MKLDKEAKRLREQNQAGIKNQADIKAVNTAIRNGANIIIKCMDEPLRLESVTPDFWYHTGEGFHRRSWCGCNDSTWRDIKRQAGVL